MIILLGIIGIALGAFVGGLIGDLGYLIGAIIGSIVGVRVGSMIFGPSALLCTLFDSPMNGGYASNGKGLIARIYGIKMPDKKG